tara:strand:- start:1276 stop:1992 length:717 start_codon:yes stop_codon:yes gene_type:complete
MSELKYKKKIWTFSGMLFDHKKLFKMIPDLLGAYIGENSIEPQVCESIMLTLNSVNKCFYCDGLHGELARVSGLNGYQILRVAKSEEECLNVMDNPAVSFARSFALNDGFGKVFDIEYKNLIKSEGEDKAKSILALCLFLHWGSLGGNTINAFINRFFGKPKENSSFIFEVLFFAYYIILFLIIIAFSSFLRILTKVPKFISSLFGVTLTFVASVWIIPLGVISYLFSTKHSILSADS